MKRSFGAILILAFILLPSAALVALTLGDVRLSLPEVVSAVFDPDSDPVHRAILVELRAPRIVLAILIGTALGSAGAAYQALFRNPLADPFVVGASSGAAAGAALVIVLGWVGTNTSGFGPASIGAFFGSLFAVWIVFSVAAVNRLPTVSLLLAGSVVSTMLGGAVWLMMALVDRELHRIVAWLMGGLAGRGWATVAGAWLPISAGTLILCSLGRPLDAIRYGEDSARALGLNVRLLISVVLVASGLSVAASVAAGGVIGFVGLIAPHLARPLVGAAHSRLVPASGLVGAILLLAADCAARCVKPPLELPIGVVTALVGGPVFLLVLRRDSLRTAEANP